MHSAAILLAFTMLYENFWLKNETAKSFWAKISNRCHFRNSWHFPDINSLDIDSRNCLRRTLHHAFHFRSVFWANPPRL